MVVAKDYAWIRKVRAGAAWDAFILTLVETDASPEDVCAAAKLYARRVGPEVDALNMEPEYTGTMEFSYVNRLGPWLAFQGENGFHMSLREYLEPMSQLGRVVGYFVNVNSDMSFYLAEHGRVLRYFDPMFYEPGEEDEGDPLPEEAGLRFRARPVAASLALIERITGQRITQEWFSDDSRQRMLISIVD